MKILKKISGFFRNKESFEEEIEEKIEVETETVSGGDDFQVVDVQEPQPEKTVKKVKPEKVFKKRKKNRKRKIQPKEKIRKIGRDEDLYELFTGVKNPGIEESSVVSSGIEEEMAELSSSKIFSYPKPQKKIDLHGMTSIEAGKKLENEIITAKIEGLDTLLFITGKGTHSKDGKSVLKVVVEEKIISLKKSGQIYTFKWEKKQKKKSGAIIVYI